MKAGTQKIGPWKRADIRSLAELCEEASDKRPSGPNGGLMALPAPSRDIREVHRAVRAHPIYLWLVRQVPRLQVLANDDALHEIQIVRVLLRCMTIAFAQGRQGRTTTARQDKKRGTATKRINQVERYLDDGTISLTQPKIDMLRRLLSDATSELTSAAPRGVKHPVLEALAFALYKELKISDVRLLSEVAASCELDCDERLAQRYVERAKKLS